MIFKMKKKYLLFWGICLFFIFVFFSFLVDINTFKQIDFDTTVRLQNNISRRLDDFFSWFSVVGMFEVTATILVLLLLVRRKMFAGFVSFFLFGLFHLIEIFGKATVENLPPPEFMLRTKRLVEFPQFHVRTEYSYPSGHSSRTIFISVMFIVFILNSKNLSKSVKAILISGIIVFDILMLLSRIYLGEHWLTDVLGGMILGCSFALIGSSLFLQHKAIR